MYPPPPPQPPIGHKSILRPMGFHLSSLGIFGMARHERQPYRIPIRVDVLLVVPLVSPGLEVLWLLLFH